MGAETVPGAREDRRSALGRAVSGRAALTALVCALPAAASDINFPVIDLALVFVSLAAVSGTWFNVVWNAARGRAEFPAPVEAGGLLPVVQVKTGLLCLLAFFTPLGLWFGAGASRGAESMAELVAQNPVQAVTLVAIATVYTPAAVVAALVYGGGLAAMWPPGWVHVARRMGRRFAGLVGVAAATSCVFWAVRLGLGWVLGDVAFVGPLLVWCAGNLVLFAQASLFGSFIRRHGQETGFVW